MKKIISLMISVLFCGLATGQAQKGFIELSASPSFVSAKEKDAHESSEILNVPVRFGYYFSRQFELEPEFILTIPDESEETGYNIVANPVYRLLSA